MCRLGAWPILHCESISQAAHDCVKIGVMVFVCPSVRQSVNNDKHVNWASLNLLRKDREAKEIYLPCVLCFSQCEKKLFGRYTLFVYMYMYMYI